MNTQPQSPSTALLWREVLRQASVALRDRPVAAWEVGAPPTVNLLASSAADPAATPPLDVRATLRRWGSPVIQGSRWVACFVDDRRWLVAPIRSKPAAPPPDGVERRSSDRLVLELAGLGLGATDVPVDAGRPRMTPAETLTALAREPSVIAHEVGNPLAAAHASLQLAVRAIQAAGTLPAGVQAQVIEDLASARAGIDQAMDYLRSIQDTSAGGTTRVRRFDVTPVILSCITLEQPLARRRGVALTLESAPQSIFLVGDPAALYQVTTNLVRNAVEASQQSRGDVTVRVERAGDDLILTVADRGSGIAPEHLSKVFEAGFTTKVPGAGTGTGLTVVQEITRKMFGGSVEVVSTLDRGTTVTLWLPIPPQRGGPR